MLKKNALDKQNKKTQNRNQILFITVFFWEPHLEISIQLAINLAAKGYAVTYCFLIIRNIEEKDTFLSLYKKIKKSFEIKKRLNKAGIKAFTFICKPFLYRRSFKVTKLQDLFSILHKKEPIGLGVASTLSDMQCNHRLDRILSFSIANPLIKRAASVFDITEKIIQRFRPSKIYSFNPRFSNTRPIYLAAKKAGCEFHTYETGSSNKKYFVTPFSIFDGSARSELIRNLWRNGPKNKWRVAKNFFHKNKATWEHGGKSENKARLKEKIKKGKINVLFCPSSIEETYALGDLYPNSLFKDQNNAFEYLLDFAAKHNEVNFILKVHPVVQKKPAEEQAYWNSFKKNSLITFISADSKISFYSLLTSVDRIIVYHSNTAIEAAFYKKSAMALGSPWYIDLGCVYKPRSKSDIYRYIFHHEAILNEIKFSNCLMYGYYLEKFGSPIKKIKDY